jgi:hypothetical protein
MSTHFPLIADRPETTHCGHSPRRLVLGSNGAPGIKQHVWRLAKKPPEKVVEVLYDQVTGSRVRHGARFLRWRPDKAPCQCTFDQIAMPLAPSQLALSCEALEFFAKCGRHDS